ncbi:erythromycin esterase family protein [Streptomyces sp. C36]|uniref:erythromycin esterase family protein n=1 Tax=Streptomyces sp. C36 TaxID=3237122 RepID=UPI0034C6418A
MSRSTSSAPSDRSVVVGLTRYAHPLRTTAPVGPAADLDAFAAMTRGANFVGLGEVSHGSKDVFTVKERVLRQLVEREGFSAFAMEINWSAAARLNTYLTTGRGDLRQIMREEFQHAYGLTNTEEYLHLFTWIREHNRAGGRQVRLVGMDFADVNPEQYERVLGWTGEHAPGLLPELQRHYAALRALPGGVATRLETYMGLPLAERKKMADDAGAAYRLLEQHGTTDPWVLQDARVVSQMATSFAFDSDDPAQATAANRHRDRTLAENAVWWQRRTGDHLVVSGHDGHVAYDSAVPAVFPVTMGADLRELVGREYVAVGTTIDSGDYRARTANGESAVFSVAPAAPGSNEYTLDQVPHRDFYIDLRAARSAPGVGAWLDTARPTYVIPGRHPNDPTPPLALGRAFDIVIHLHTVRASVLLPPTK